MYWRETGSWEETKEEDTLDKVRSSYSGQRVTDLLRKPVVKEEPQCDTLIKKIAARINTFFSDWVYKWQDDFQYSSRIISILWIGFVVMFMAAFRAIWGFTSLALALVDASGSSLDEIGWDDVTGESTVRQITRSLLKVYYYGVSALWILVFICITLAFIIGTLSILYILTNYRANMRALNRGDNSYIPARKTVGHVTLLIGSMRYAGYQIGYIAWALVIQAFFFVVVVIVVVMAVVVAAVAAYTWLVDTIAFFWPWIIVLILIMLGQHFSVKYLFLQNHEESLSIDNRRALFTTNYFLFFYNVFIGLGSCLLRLVKSMFLGVLLISRLDLSLLPKRFELHDTGFEHYVGFMHTECYHTHPCMLTFIRLLIVSCNETKKEFLPHHQLTADSSKSCQSNPFTSKSVFSNRLPHLKNNKVANGQTRNLTSMSHTEDNGEVTLASTLETGDVKSVDQPSPPVNVCIIEGVQETKVPTEDNNNSFDAWIVLRDSPAMKKYRARQRAAFRWALLYTVHCNPRLLIERKESIRQNNIQEAKMASEKADKEADKTK